MRQNPPWLALFVIPAAALVVVLPLILHGCSCGHDFDFHLISWMEAAAQFRAGTLHPAWAFSPAWDAGEPRFIFYPPLSWTLGGLLGMILPWAAVPIVFTWLALVAGGVGMYRFAREFAGEQAASLGAVVFIANPYMIFTAYERTAYGELLAAAWIPMLLAGILRKRITVLGVAVPVALLWLSNVPAAVMGCYSLALLAVVRVVWSWLTDREIASPMKTRTAGAMATRVALGTLLAFGLAAIYLVPAAHERDWIQVSSSMTPIRQLQNSFLFHHTDDAAHDAVLHTVSVIAVLLLSVTAVVFFLLYARSKRARNEASTIVLLALLAMAIGFLLTPASGAVWRVLPEFAYVLFSWRLLAILAAVLSAGITLISSEIALKKPVMLGLALALTVAMVAVPVRLFRQFCDDEDAIAPRLAVFLAGTGTDPTDEDTPVGADDDQLSHANPPYWLAERGDTAAPIAGTAAQVPQRFSVLAKEPEVLILNLRSYPGWEVWVNGTRVTERIQRGDGLIALPVPAGSLHVDVEYVRPGDQRLGEAVSAASLSASLGLAGLARRRRSSRIIED